MVSKDKLKNIYFFTCFFAILSFIVLFPKIDSNDLRKNHERELNEMLAKYKDKDSESWKKFKEKPIKIVFWHRLDPEKEKEKNLNALEEIIQEFNKEYPNITIKTQYKPSWSGIVKNINVALPANNEPHLIFSYADHLVNYYESGKLVPLDGFKDHINEKIKLESCDTEKKTYFYSNFEDEAQLPFGDEKEPGKWYSLPFAKSIELMYYNQDYFKDLKVKIQKQNIKINSVFFESCFEKYYDSNFEGKLKDGITWEQMGELCKIIKQIDPEKIPVSHDSESNLFIVASEQRGIEYTASPTKKDPSSREVGVLFNNPDAKTMIKDFKKFYNNKYLITRKLSCGNDITHLFMDQKILMSISSSNGFEYISKAPFTVGITSVPYWKKGKQGASSGKRKVLQQGANINLFYKKDKDEVLASWLFLKHLTSKKTNEKLIKKLSQFPTRPCANITLEISKPEELKDKIFKFMKDERQKDEEKSKTGNSIYFFSPTFRKSQMSRIVVEKLLIDCFLDKDLDKNIDTLFNEAQQKADS